MLVSALVLSIWSSLDLRVSAIPQATTTRLFTSASLATPSMPTVLPAPSTLSTMRETAMSVLQELLLPINDIAKWLDVQILLIVRQSTLETVLYAISVGLGITGMELRRLAISVVLLTHHAQVVLPPLSAQPAQVQKFPRLTASPVWPPPQTAKLPLAPTPLNVKPVILATSKTPQPSSA